MDPIKYSFLIFGFLILLCTEIHTESGTNSLLEAESMLIENLESYIADFESQINKLKSNLEEFQREHDEASEDVTTYLSNPINAYLLTKRLTTDWKHVEALISTDTGSGIFNNITSFFGENTLPNEADLRDEIHRLDRLRSTYNLPMEEIASGVIDGLKYSDPLSAVECFEIGRQLYLTSQFDSANQWLEFTLRKFENETHNEDEADLAKASILDFYSMTKFRLGQYSEALALAKDALELQPEFTHIIENIQTIVNARATEAELTIKSSEKVSTKDALQLAYKEGCRGELQRNSSVLRDLYCKYFTENHPFLILAPFKMEVLNLDPFVAVYYDLISDKEIKTLKDMSTGKLTPATVWDPVRGLDVLSPSRSSRYYAIEHLSDPVLDLLDTRMDDITGLDVTDAGEQLQISSYDVGGHYVPHHDALSPEAGITFDFAEEMGNRIASVLIYLNDVEKGGATIFPRINLTVWPKKGSAIFYYNLHRNGSLIINSEHGGCPVLKGTKWILSKWIREFDQISKRPCGLNENDD